MSSIRSRAPSASSKVVRRVMQANTQVETAPEKAIRSCLHRAGLRFRKDCRPEKDLRCKADVVFPRLKTCVFVDGCFWHGCPLHFKCPQKNSSWWREKINDNVARDRRQTEALSALGWKVVRIWEHDVMKYLSACVNQIVVVVRDRQREIRTRRETP